MVLVRDLRTAIQGLNPDLPTAAVDDAVQKLTYHDYARSMVQHNREFYDWMRNGVPVSYRDAAGQQQDTRARVIDYRTPGNNRFLVVRELKIQGLKVPQYNRRADLVCFVNGLPLVFFELKAVYRNIRAAYDGNLSDYRDTIPHAFHHNAFLVVSNGDAARYGTITASWDHFGEWKRNDEQDAGHGNARTLLDGMLDKARLLDLVQNFILFDQSRPGGIRKVIARNHQVLGVNRAVESVLKQEELKRAYPQRVRPRMAYRTQPMSVVPPIYFEQENRTLAADLPAGGTSASASACVDGPRGRGPSPECGMSSGGRAGGPAGRDLRPEDRRSFPDDAPPDLALPLVERAHPDLGRLGVFWHTQGSGKSYSMAFFTEKVRRTVPGNFTFLMMTDREDLDDQIYHTFVGCGIVDPKTTPRAATGTDLRRILGHDHRYVFSLIHKFNQPVHSDRPYSRRDDIIVLSDEAHRTQAGKLARNMRLALPNAAFIGFTGTPLFKYDQLTRRIFGDYVSRYDFERSRQDGSTVKLVYENRGEKLGITRLDLNDRIAEKIEEADLKPDQLALLEKLLGKDYEVITADDRLIEIADDFVGHCSKRWESGKSMLVCIDKITCGRMCQLIIPRWKVKIGRLREEEKDRAKEFSTATDPDVKERLDRQLERLHKQIAWMETTIIEIIISDGQNEVRDFKRWGVDIKPHRQRIRTGFETPDGKRIDVETAFKDPEHPFRIAIVCAMWLTGFDVECLATLYIDKPMKAHTLMQAIARANRVYPGKACGVIVDYNGMLKSLREALAQYALGDGSDTGGGGGGGGGGGEDDVVDPLEKQLEALRKAIEATEKHLAGLGFDVARLVGAKGFDRIEALADAVEAVSTSDDARRRYGILARLMFACFKALLTEPSAVAYAERHDNIEAIYRKLEDELDKADVTEVLKALHRIVNASITAQGRGSDHATGLKVDLSKIDFQKLRKEFEKRVRRKCTAVHDIATLLEAKLKAMLARNPKAMDYYKKYQAIIADYNREKDRATVEATFAKLFDLTKDLDAEERRAIEEGLTDDELALFDLVLSDKISKANREKLKQASRDLLAKLQDVLRSMEHWTLNAQTQAEVETLILDHLYVTLPRPPFTDDDTKKMATRVYDYVWQRSAAGVGFTAAAAG
jgi:type I restriction enzyme R subunit